MESEPWTIMESIWLQQQLDAALAAGDSDKVWTVNEQIQSRPVQGPVADMGVKVPRQARLKATNVKPTVTAT
jgi:hypothetical protein